MMKRRILLAVIAVISVLLTLGVLYILLATPGSTVNDAIDNALTETTVAETALAETATFDATVRAGVRKTQTAVERASLDLVPFTTENVQNMQLLKTIDLGYSTDVPNLAIDISSTGDVAFAVGASIVVWKYSDIDSPSWIFRTSDNSWPITFRPYSNELLAMDSPGNNLYRWDLTTGESLSLPYTWGGDYFVGWSEDGSQFATFDGTDVVYLWSFDENNRVAIDVPRYSAPVVYFREDETLIAFLEDGLVRIRSYPGEEVISEIPFESTPNFLGFGSDGDTILMRSRTGSFSGAVTSLFEVRSGDRVAQIETRNPLRTAFQVNSDLVLVNTSGGDLMPFSTTDSGSLSPIPVHKTENLVMPMFDPMGSLLLTVAGDDPIARIWHIPD